MTVYYGGNLCDSDESDWEDPYDIASQQYVDDYNFDVPEGMDLMGFERGGGPSKSEMLDEERTGLTLVCQTTLSVPEGKLYTVNIDPLANVASATLSETVTDGSPTFRCGGGPYNCETMLSEDEDIRHLDEGSIEDDERNIWADWCDSAFWTAFGTFPSEADGPQPTVAFSDGLFSDEVLADSAGSDHKELPMLALRIFSDVGVTVIPTIVDRPVIRIMVGR